MYVSRSANGKYTEIIEKRGSKNARKFQRLISGAMASGKIAKSVFKKGAAAGA